MITNKGITTIRDWIKSGNEVPPTNIGVGLGTTAPLENNLILANEVYPTTSRNSCTITKSSDVVIYYMNQATTEGSTATYSEHGLFTNSTTGEMYTRQTYPDTDKDNTINMETYISIEVSSYLP